MPPCQRVHLARAFALGLALASAGGALGCAGPHEAGPAALAGLRAEDARTLDAVLVEAGVTRADVHVIGARADFPLPFALRTRLVPDRRAAAPDRRGEARARGPLVLVEGDRVVGLALPGAKRVDVGRLRGLGALAFVDLDGAGLVGASELGTLTGLVYADLSRTGLEDVTPLTRLPALRALVAVKTAVREVPSLGPTLEHVDLSYGRVEELPAEGPRVEVLALTGNRLTSLRSKGSLPALATLTLDENRVEEIAGLEAYPKLGALSLAGNRVRAVPDLTPGFRYLSLEGNPVPRDPSTLAHVNALRARGVLFTL